MKAKLASQRDTLARLGTTHVDVKEWANANGHVIHPKAVFISTELLAAYEVAHVS